MSADSKPKTVESFRLFSSPSSNVSLGWGFSDPAETKPICPPPPCVEVLPSDVSSAVKYVLEPVNIGGLTLLKGRVSTHEVFALSNSDLVPGRYEGGLKLWEGSLDLVKALQSEVQKEKLSFKEKRVLELGCGQGLPGIFASLEGAAAIHFQDFNAEVLRCLTIPNISANILNETQPSAAIGTDGLNGSEIRFFAGDWSEIYQLFPFVHDHGKDLKLSSGCSSVSGYDVILMAETVYSISTFQSLYKLIKMCMARPSGVVYMAAKKHYFGVGGGTRQFLSVVEKDGCMAASLVAEVADGSSNVRQVWKLWFK